MACVEIKNLGFTYPGCRTPTLHGITTQVSCGAFVLLTGPTGCGKSTLLRTLNGLIPHASAGTLAGTVLLNGKDIATQPLVATCRQIALLFQNPDDQLFCTLVEDEIAFGLENLSVPSEKIKERIDFALEKVGLAGFENQQISSLSGGQKQRVALAAVCAMQPKVLLLDEPTSHLDPQGTRDILASVARLNREMGITVILATHRTRKVAPICNHIWLMDNGHLCLDLTKAEAFQNNAPYRRLGVQVPFEEKTPSTVPLSTRTTPAIPNSRDLSLSIHDLYFRYPNADKDTLRSVSCETRGGEVLAIMGANGSGKTTLIHLIAGLLHPSAGEITIAGKGHRRVKLHQLAGKVGIVFQNPDLLLQAKTVRDEVEFGPKNLKLPTDPLEKRVKKMLTRFDLTHLSSEAPYALSRGQRQRLAVAANFSLHPDLLLLDEPTTGQDARHLSQLMDALCDEIRGECKTLIFATHDTDLTLKYADRVLLLRYGQIIFDGSPEIAFNNSELLARASL